MGQKQGHCATYKIPNIPLSQLMSAASVPMTSLFSLWSLIHIWNLLRYAITRVYVWMTWILSGNSFLWQQCHISFPCEEKPLVERKKKNEANKQKCRVRNRVRVLRSPLGFLGLKCSWGLSVSALAEFICYIDSENLLVYRIFLVPTRLLSHGN